MTRPRKATVDYFPHECHHGKTMFILEQKYGNDGCAFWFKLLELLGSTENHFIDCRNPAAWEFLQAKTRLDKNTCNEILDLLAVLEAISPKYWQSKIIWSANFIRNISPVYANRRVDSPLEPDFYMNISQTKGISTCRKPQSRESRVEDSRLEEQSTLQAEPSVPSVYSCQYFDVSEQLFLELQDEYPGLTSDQLLDEIKKMGYWIDDNKAKRKFDAKGRVKNFRLGLANWLKRVETSPENGKKSTRYDGLAKWAARQGDL